MKTIGCGTQSNIQNMNERGEGGRTEQEGLGVVTTAESQLAAARSEISHLKMLLDYRNDALLETNKIIEELYEEVTLLKCQILETERNTETRTTQID